MAKMVKITLTKSLIGASPKQRKVVKGAAIRTRMIPTWLSER